MISIPSFLDASLYLLKDTISAQTSCQKDYDKHFAEFMASSPICPFCSNKLHRHDSFSRSFYCAFEKIKLNCRRVYCPHCKKTHRVLPSYIIPGHQILLDDATSLSKLVAQQKSCTLFSLQSGLSFSAVYRFFKKIICYFRHVLTPISFYDLFLSQRLHSYRQLLTDFFDFQIFQLGIG